MNANDRFEITADLFQRATGMLRPGKDQAAAMGNTPSREERQLAFDKWRAERAYDDAVKYIHKLHDQEIETRATIDYYEEDKIPALTEERDAMRAALRDCIDKLDMIGRHTCGSCIK